MGSRRMLNKLRNSTNPVPIMLVPILKINGAGLQRSKRMLNKIPV